MNKSRAIAAASSTLLASAVACRPVIAIGWTEFGIIVVLLMLLFGPLVIRLIRRISGDRDNPPE